MLDFANDVLTLLLTAAISAVARLRGLTVATLLPLPMIAFLVHRVRNRMRRGFALGTRAWGEMTSVLADTIPGIRVVKAFAQERREIERFRAANDRVFAGQLSRQHGVGLLRADREPVYRAWAGCRLGVWLVANLSTRKSRSAI